MSELIQIDTKQKKYTIYLGVKLETQLNQFIQTPGKRVFVVYDEHLKHVFESLSHLPFICSGYQVASGESSKSISEFHSLHTELMHIKFKRSDSLLALGGGVVGDLTGFVAATYQRGCGFIQCPTTILSQVDSSVGGKTAINHELGKNMIGAFYQPDAVIIDFELLSSLPQRQIVNGFAEVIKAAILKDSELFHKIEQVNGLEYNQLHEIVSGSIKVKRFFVESDEKDLGIRNQLNLGHTFGHAIETIYQYKEYLHGEAVAIGMVIASQFAYDNNLLSKQDLSRIVGVIKKVGLPIELPKKCNAENMLQHMLLDKKNLQDGVTLIIPRTIGHCEILKNYPAEQLKAWLEGFFSHV